MLFSSVFFKLYDQKMMAGEVTFGELRISKDDFTHMCTVPEYVPDQETILRLITTMKLDEEEAEEFLQAAGMTSPDPVRK